MGIVLPEGVLNNTNLQRCAICGEQGKDIADCVYSARCVYGSRCYSKAQLLFFKKFTENEAEEYNRIYIQASHEVEVKYDEEMTDINAKLAKRGKEALTKDEKKSLRSRKKELTV